MASIMIVEDEFIVAQDLALSLTAMGYEVCGSFESGESAMEKVKTEQPDMILMDIVLMGNVDGIQAARNIREQFDIPIIFFSAYADQELLERAKMAEPFGYLLKPFTNKELRSAIEIGLYKAEMERKLRVSEKRFKDMANLLPSVICEVDATLRVTFINKAGLNLFKLSKNDVAQGVNITAFFPVDKQSKMLKRFNRVLSGQKLDSTECRMTDKEGAILSLIVNLAPIQAGDIITGVRTSIVDITEIKKLQLRLRQAWKMEAIASLAGGIAHEFNNALANIVGYVELMKFNQPIPVEVQEFADKIMASANRMASLTDQILAFARGGKYWPITASLNEFVQNELSLILPSLKPEIQVLTELHDDVILVEMDEKQFQFVLAALVANACEAMDNNGCIRIKTQNVTVDEESASQKAGLKPGLYACLQVEDNGSGMDEDTRQRIFEPFFSTKFSGRGLGMAAVYGIIKNHEGWIGVDSTLNSGTVVSIFLPEPNSSL